MRAPDTAKCSKQAPQAEVLADILMGAEHFMEHLS
jgi:hypothetical protein